MSASRTKNRKVIPRQPVEFLSAPKTPAVTPAKVASRLLNGSRAPAAGQGSRIAVAGGRNGTPTSLTAAKGKSRALPRPQSAPISVGSSSDDEDDFEEVAIPPVAGPSSPFGAPTTPGSVLTRGTTPATPGTATTAASVDEEEAYGEDDDEEAGETGDGVIRLEIGGETDEQKAKRIALALRKKPITSKDRAIRLEAHKLHVISLLASARIRNRWCSNLLLRARLLSLLPHPLQTAFHIPPSRFPDRAQRSRLFFDALQSLVTWWSQSFFDISDFTIGLRTRTWDEVDEIVKQLPRLTKAALMGGEFKNAKEREKEQEDLLEKLSQGAGEERLRSVNSFMKKVLQQEGSRDVSAQLFVALARACGLGARLVASLQAVPWRAEKVTTKKKLGAGRNGRLLASRQGVGPASEEEDEDDLEEVPIPGFQDGGPGAAAEKTKKNNLRAAGPGRLKDPADLYRLRKPKPEPQRVGVKPKPKRKEDLSQQPPVFWAEVFSRSDQRWIPVDPVSGVIRKKTHYEPVSDSGPIRMLYVIAFEEDGYARDVTLRYAKNFGAKTAKLRVPAKKDEPDWWGEVMGFLQRPYRLNRDELEDAELETSHMSEGMPQHMSGFKDHPIYVLERHLKREEVLNPKREIGRFRGEPVYRRANVLSCKTAENWMRVGRRVKDRQEPLKWVKQRAVTLNKRRAQELARQEGQDEPQQGLYAEYQTEIYRPPPIKDGHIPQNSFGNIDLYAPTMLPKGAVHLAFKGIAKVAKALGISYAEACTGFEFKKQRALPIITGIVVAEENEALVLEAYWESAAAHEEKEKAKREDRALKRWVKLINGLRVRRRLQAEYGEVTDLHEPQVNPLAKMDDTATPKKRTAADVIANNLQENKAAWRDRMRSQSVEAPDEHAIESSGDENIPENAASPSHSRAAGIAREPRVKEEMLDTATVPPVADSMPVVSRPLGGGEQSPLPLPLLSAPATATASVSPPQGLESVGETEDVDMSPPPLSTEINSALHAQRPILPTSLTPPTPSALPTSPTRPARSARTVIRLKVPAASPHPPPPSDSTRRSAAAKSKSLSTSTSMSMSTSKPKPKPKSKSKSTSKSTSKSKSTSTPRGGSTRPSRSGVTTPAAQAAPAPTTRSLRSRQPKSEAEAKREEARRAQLRAALESDDEGEDEDEDQDGDADVDVDADMDVDEAGDEDGDDGSGEYE